MSHLRILSCCLPSALLVALACIVPVATDLTTCSPVTALPLAAGHKRWSNSPLTDAQQRALEHAQGFMRSGNYNRATSICQQVLDECGDVPKCLAVAAATEAVGLPMLESRRACLDKAISLVQNSDDMILVALKARQYQFFEITRQSVQALLGKAHTLPELYTLASRCQEVSLNDIAHMAMEKAYSGVKNAQDDLTFLEYCKRMGMEDLQRKAVKDVIDSQTDVTTLCDQMLRMKDGGYAMRDMNRYGLRKCMDEAKTVDEMQAIFEVARQLEEPDFATRAQYFVRKGKIIEQIKSDRANYEAQLRAWREGIDIDTARMQDPRLNPDAGQAKPTEGGGGGVGF